MGLFIGLTKFTANYTFFGKFIENRMITGKLERDEM